MEAILEKLLEEQRNTNELLQTLIDALSETWMDEDPPAGVFLDGSPKYE